MKMRFMCLCVIALIVLSGCSQKDKESSSVTKSTSSTDVFGLQGGDKSAARTTLRNAISSVKSMQTGLGLVNFEGIDTQSLSIEEPDLIFTEEDLKGNKNENVVYVSAGEEQILLATRSQDGVCYYVELNANDATRYASAKTDSCSSADAQNTDFTKVQSDGWATE